jgi:hypothetical protein
MPRIRRDLIARSETFNALAQEASVLREQNDCTVKAVAVAANTSAGAASAASAGTSAWSGSVSHSNCSSMEYGLVVITWRQ